MEILYRCTIFLLLLGFNGIVPLHKVALRGDVSLLELFVSKGADINAANNHGETPLMFATKRGNLVVRKRKTESALK